MVLYSFVLPQDHTAEHNVAQNNKSKGFLSRECGVALSRGLLWLIAENWLKL